MFQLTFSVAFALGPWLGMQALEVFGARALWIAASLFGVLSALMMVRVKTPEPA